MHRITQKTTRKDIYVEEYPDPFAGAPVGPEKYPVETRDLSNHPLADPRLFETAHWLGNASISDEYRKEFFLHENVCLIWRTGWTCAYPVAESTFALEKHHGLRQDGR
jgi:hypothetical protein